jgi:hypothetical protein
MVGFLSTQYPFLYTDKIQPSSSTCNLIFFRPFVSANPNPNVVVSEPDKVKISASPSADIARWSNRCIGFWQPLSSTHWLDNVKRVVSIYTRHPSTRLILFIFDCVLEQLWRTWSTNSKLQNIFLEETQPEQTNPSNLVNITSELSSFRSTYSPLATRYNHKTSPLPPDQKANFQADLLTSTGALKSLLRDLRAWLALSHLSGPKLASAALPSLFSSLFHKQFSHLVHALRRVAQALDACAAPNRNPDLSPTPNSTIDALDTDTDLPASTPAPSTQASQRPGYDPDPNPETATPPGARQYPPSTTSIERGLLYQQYLSLPSFSSTPRFWWCGYACVACAFELANEGGHWRCNRCDYGDYGLCAQCLVRLGGCKGQVAGRKHVLEWVRHPFLEGNWRKFELDTG